MKKKKVLMLIVFFTITAGLWSCQWHIIEPVEIVTPDEVSFSSDLEQVFVSKCGSCHGTGSPNFSSGNVYQSLTNGLINTSDPESSEVYIKLSGDHPSPSGTFSDTELALLLKWIEQGALDN